MGQEVIVGIDAGGSSTRARALRRGVLVHEGAGGPGNPLVAGPETIRASYRAALDGCPAAARVAACVSGSGGDPERAQVAALLASGSPRRMSMSLPTTSPLSWPPRPAPTCASWLAPARRCAAGPLTAPSRSAAAGAGSSVITAARPGWAGPRWNTPRWPHGGAGSGSRARGRGAVVRRQLPGSWPTCTPGCGGIGAPRIVGGHRPALLDRVEIDQRVRNVRLAQQVRGRDGDGRLPNPDRASNQQHRHRGYHA